MRKALFIALFVSFALCLSACIGGGGKQGGDQGGTPSQGGVDEPSVVEPVGTVFTPVDMTVAGDDQVRRSFTLVGVELDTTDAGSRIIRAIFDFTNNAHEMLTAEEGQDFFIIYDDEELDDLRYPESELGWAAYLKVLPGQTIRFAREFYLKKGVDYTGDFTIRVEHGDSMYLHLIEMLGGDATGHHTELYIAETTVSPADLPARPAAEWQPKAFDLAARYQGIPESGNGITWGGTVEFKDISVSTIDGVPCLTVSILYTNLRDSARSFQDEANFRAFQDGAELDRMYQYIQDDPYYADRAEKLATGESKVVTIVYRLRTDSEVGLEFEDYYDDGKVLVAKTVSVK